MSYIKLTFAASSRPPVELREEIVRLGRDPFSTIAFSGDEAKVVSTHHAELRWRDGAWRLADQASRNGTYLNGQRLATEATLKQGDEIGLGESGPRLSVVAVEEALVQTLVEYPGVESPPPPAVSRAYGVTAGCGMTFQGAFALLHVTRRAHLES